MARRHPLQFFADESDLPIVCERLNSDKEIAFVIPDGPLTPEEAYLRTLRATFAWTGSIDPLDIIDTGYRQRWKALAAVPSLRHGTHFLWHTAAGPLLQAPASEESPDGLASGFLGQDPYADARPIQDPSQGWADTGRGPLHDVDRYNLIGLNLNARSAPYTESERRSEQMLVSHWTGESECLVVSSFGWSGNHRRPSPLTLRWWNRLRSWLVKSTVRLSDPRDRQSFFAFPSALGRLKIGTPYYANGWNLDDSISRLRDQ